MIHKKNRKKPMLWKRAQKSSLPKLPVYNSNFLNVTSLNREYEHASVDLAGNQKLRQYETSTKHSFDNIENVIKRILSGVHRDDFASWASKIIQSELDIRLNAALLNLNPNTNPQFLLQTLYCEAVFAQAIRLSETFFIKDPLNGQGHDEIKKKFLEAGIHAVGVSPCSDGRLAHVVSYALRLPFSLARRKSHAGGLFDVSESVRNWVFVEHERFRVGASTGDVSDSKFLKIAVYHFSGSDSHCQGCAAHGSDDVKAASASLQKLNDFKQAIANRFGCASEIQTMLLGLNTDNDSLRVHIPDSTGRLSIERYVSTDNLFDETKALDQNQIEDYIAQSIDECNKNLRTSLADNKYKNLLVWLILNNFSQVAYVRQFEGGCYKDIGHAERFIGIGNGFEEVQLRNLSYYSFLDTIEEGVNDVEIGIKIFKKLNVQRGLPIPIIIRCDYDGRVPGSYDRAKEKANRLKNAVVERYTELAECGLLKVMSTLRDKTSYKPAERI